MNTGRRLLGAALLLGLSACSGEQPGTTAASLPKLVTMTVTAGSDGGGRSWDGVVEAVRQAELSAQTSGRVTSVEVDVNDAVVGGQVLLRLTAVEQQAGASAARAQLRAAEAMAAEAAANHARYQALAGKQFVSRLQLDQARAARDAAAANRDAARAQLAQAGQLADYTVVRAPFAGIVSARHVEPGESLSPGQPLLVVHAPRALRIEVQVPQSDADAIRKLGAARVALDDGRVLDAASVVVFPAADPSTHSVGVRIMLPDTTNPPRPGSTAKVQFPIAEAAGAAAVVHVPQSVVVQRGEVSGVYVMDGNRLSLRQLRLGRRIGDQVEVLAGLKAGETLASDPVAALQALAVQRKAAAASHD